MATLKIAVLPHAKDLPLPSYASDGASGIDLRAAGVGDAMEWLYWLGPRQRVLVKTGLSIEIEHGFEAQIRSRSGLALNHGIQVHPGTIDRDYRGEIGVILFNLGHANFEIRRGDRIAQMVIAPVDRARIMVSLPENLTDTGRGSGGFGHTGVR